MSKVMEELPFRWVCAICDKPIEPGEEYRDHWNGPEHTCTHEDCHINE